MLSFVDPGNGQHSRTSVSSIAKGSAKSPRLCSLLAAMIKYFKPEMALEMGTSLGLSSLYQWKELPPDAKFITLEGNPAVIPYAQKNFRQLGVHTIRLEPGLFSDTLPIILAEIDTLDWAFIDGHHQYQPTLDFYGAIAPKLKENSVLIFGDINW